MNIRHAAHLLGGDACGRYVVCPGPGHSPQDRSLKVSFAHTAPGGFLVHSFAKDDFRECRDFVRERLGSPTSSRKAARPMPATTTKPSRANSDADRIARALALWQEARQCNELDRYLVGRGLSLPDEVRQADTLRFHPACPFRLRDRSTVRLPSMVALMRNIATNEPCGIHRTALKPDGSGKAEMLDGSSPKKMLGPAKGAVVKLTSDEDVLDGLGIAEGVETALTVLCAGWRPVWAALSAGTIADFPVLPGIETLTVFGDADPTGLAAAQECQARWRAAGRECPIVLPPHDGTDWNAWRAA